MHLNNTIFKRTIGPINKPTKKKKKGMLKFEENIAGSQKAAQRKCQRLSRSQVTIVSKKILITDIATYRLNQPWAKSSEMHKKVGRKRWAITIFFQCTRYGHKSKDHLSIGRHPYKDLK